MTIVTKRLGHLVRMSTTRKYSTHLHSFLSSPNTFQILNPSSTPPTDDALYILDSSFNPPTNAHLALAKSSLSAERKSTVLLLLAIQNADKPSKPASFDHRLEMMDLLARKIEYTSCASALIALSKHPRFVDKAKDITSAFPEMNTIVWLVGYDTLIRILDQKYYRDSLEESLSGFWERNRLVCAIRGDDVEERGYIEGIKKGEVQGVPSEWGEYIKVIEPVGKEHSSTKARKAAFEGQWEELGKVVPEEIAEYIRTEGLYREE